MVLSPSLLTCTKMGATKEWFLAEFQQRYEPLAYHELELEDAYTDELRRRDELAKQVAYWRSEAAGVDAACEARENEAHYQGQ